MFALALVTAAAALVGAAANFAGAIRHRNLDNERFAEHDERIARVENGTGHGP